MAVCNLEELRMLALNFWTMDKWDGECNFKSSQLKKLRVRFNGREKTLAGRILRLVHANCRNLVSVDYDVGEPLSSDLLHGMFSRNDSLSLLRIGSYTATAFYSFSDIINGGKNLHNLRKLTLPWPFEFANRSMQTIELADCTPRRLTFQHCTALAGACPMLDEIKFQLDMDQPFTQYQTPSLAGADHQI
jgi:hypothetical protein